MGYTSTWVKEVTMSPYFNIYCKISVTKSAVIKFKTKLLGINSMRLIFGCFN